MTDNDFLEQQRRAIERMNEMYEKQQIKSGGYKMPPVPSFVKVTNVEEQKNKETAPLKNNFTEEKNSTAYSKNNQNIVYKPTNSVANLKLPFLKGGMLDNDISLLLGLILILANEKADRRLLLALLYILM